MLSPLKLESWPEKSVPPKNTLSPPWRESAFATLTLLKSSTPVPRQLLGEAVIVPLPAALLWPRRRMPPVRVIGPVQPVLSAVMARAPA